MLGDERGLVTLGRGLGGRTELGFAPRYTTAEAFADFAADLAPTFAAPDQVLGQLAERLPEPDVERSAPVAVAPGSVHPFVAPGGPRG